MPPSWSWTVRPTAHSHDMKRMVPAAGPQAPRTGWARKGDGGRGRAGAGHRPPPPCRALPWQNRCSRPVRCLRLRRAGRPRRDGYPRWTPSAHSNTVSVIERTSGNAEVPQRVERGGPHIRGHVQPLVTMVSDATRRAGPVSPLTSAWGSPSMLRLTGDRIRKTEKGHMQLTCSFPSGDSSDRIDDPVFSLGASSPNG